MRLLALLFAFAVPYRYVQAVATVAKASPGTKTLSVRVDLHNTGDLAASCTVRLGGQTKVTGVSASGDAVVSFDGITSYKGYTLACKVN